MDDPTGPVVSRRSAGLLLVMSAAILAGVLPARAADQEGPLRGSGGRLFWQQRQLDEQERRRRWEESQQRTWQEDRRRQRLREQSQRDREGAQRREIDRVLERRHKEPGG